MDLKVALSKNRPTIGTWLNLGHASVTEIVADSGFDWIVVDLEHSVISLREAEEAIRIIQLNDIPALVRVTTNDPNQIKRVMDAGADGIIVPMINTAEQAQAAVSAAKYPPGGNRGVGLARAQGYGRSFEKYAGSINNHAIVIAQIEHANGIANLESILGVEGIDATFVGPYDLSASFGKPGDLNCIDMQQAMAEYISISKARSKPMGYHIVNPDPEALANKYKEGFTFLALAADFLLLADACDNKLKIARELLAG